MDMKQGDLKIAFSVLFLMIHDEPFTGTLIPDKEGKPSIARRYKYIPENMQQKVVDKYFDFHKGLSCK